MTTAADLGPGAKRLADLVAQVSDDDLGKPTPCPAYTLGDLIAHVGDLALAFTAAARKAGGPYVERARRGDAANLGQGWREQIPADLQSLGTAWAEPGAWTGMTRIAGMDSPAEMVGLTAADEIVVHGWDMAQATGQPYACEPDLLDAAQEFLSQFASPDAPEGPEVAFGPSRLAPDDAPRLDKIVALAGRDLAWTPR
ncbi:MAG: TIGR03086 family protein [Nocardiopsaceae bacterium]|jgi:uncharacterized protein (TIGR03086 family)|nr:TIGR03086 family protein [Nocardiopsaceae bacterium]